MPEWFPLHTQTHFVSLSKSPTRDSKFFSESAGKERLKYEGRMANGTYIYVHISLIYNLWNITLPAFFTPVWASSMCAEAKCQRTFGRKGTLVCTGTFLPGLRRSPCQSTADCISFRSTGPLCSSSHEQGPAALMCLELLTSQNVTSATYPTFLLCSYCSFLSSVMNNY